MNCAPLEHYKTNCLSFNDIQKLRLNKKVGLKVCSCHNNDVILHPLIVGNPMMSNSLTH